MREGRREGGREGGREGELYIRNVNIVTWKREEPRLESRSSSSSSNSNSSNGSSGKASHKRRNVRRARYGTFVDPFKFFVRFRL